MPWDVLNNRLVDQYGRPDPGSMDYSPFHPAAPTPDPLAPEPIPTPMGRAEAQSLYQDEMKPQPWDAGRIIDTILGVPLLPLKVLSGVDQAIKGAAGIPTLADDAARARAVLGGEKYQPASAIDRFLGQITGDSRTEADAATRIMALAKLREDQRNSRIKQAAALQGLERGSYGLHEDVAKAPYADANAFYNFLSGKNSALIGGLNLEEKRAQEPYFGSNAMYGAMNTEAGAKEAALKYGVDLDYLRKNAEQDYVTGGIDQTLKGYQRDEAIRQHKGVLDLKALLAAQARAAGGKSLLGDLDQDVEPEALKEALQFKTDILRAPNPAQSNLTPPEIESRDRAAQAAKTAELEAARRELDVIADRDIRGAGKPYTGLVKPFFMQSSDPANLIKGIAELRRKVDAALSDPTDPITIPQARAVMARTRRIEEFTTKYTTPEGLPMSTEASATPVPAQAPDLTGTGPDTPVGGDSGPHDTLKAPPEALQRAGAKTLMDLKQEAQMEASRRGLKEGSQDYRDLIDTWIDMHKDQLAR